MIAYPYGWDSETETGRCVNVEPGTFNHECGRPAVHIGIKADGFRAMFCSGCKRNGSEARHFERWTVVKPGGAS